MAPKTGVVKWFNEVKGHGFITQDDGGPDVFVHHSIIQGERKALSEGDLVTYETKDAVKGPAATTTSIMEGEMV
ncbi:cold shock protein, transcription antiterminator, affects expression of rpoS and uspA [Ceratobasidium sp. AG-I]|nr:cold shock protein, transcription antiterminator, affects expression of rpoS and uspA [Ceratobasidium sp. AG-I]